ncbi:snare-like protein [Hyphopichia burtonii NRRL Y-1933]|uniref:Coatomer subunit zeta n=1 Tax=Hyphopichia burtonii NRRL Y-1933 TaxID=984485 RepID=A0A1E4RK89_9ASCO|nr:snare-like protein [Hyphopichia burtonii NRRL Y-1933]ODV67656.1 snare-like protein [Hyphopichia burtonii NRRL Y-1933]
MSLNISLYTVSAALILDNKGSRLYAKYYQTKENEIVSNPYKSLNQQLKFEEQLFSKINKVNQDIILYDNHLITYKQTNDVIIALVSSINENESLIYSLTNNLNEALSILLDNTLDKSTILEKYDLVSLCIDETIDDGIILEIDPSIIVSRVTNTPSNSAISNDLNLNKIELSEKGLFNALSFASKKIGERLQQGL